MSRAAFYRETTTPVRGPVQHAREAEPVSVGERFGDIEAATVIHDVDVKLIGLVRETHRRVRGVGVLNAVL